MNASKKFKCSTCDYTSEQKGNVNRHIKTKHEMLKIFECDECPDVPKFTLKQHFVTHKKKHTGEVHTCDQCDFYTIYKYKLKAHKNTHGEKNKKCYICEMSYSDNQTLKAHINFKHDGEAVNCKHCDFKTANKFNMDRHEKTRHENNRIKCPHDSCTTACATKENLKRHIDEIHLRIKKFKCEMCEYKCTQKANLKKHQKKHEKKKNQQEMFEKETKKDVVNYENMEISDTSDDDDNGTEIKIKDIQFSDDED